MVSKDDVINVIMKITEGDTTKKFTRNSVMTYLGLKSKQVDKIFDDLEREGFIKLKETKGKAKYYVLSNGTVRVENESFKAKKRVI